MCAEYSSDRRIVPSRWLGEARCPPTSRTDSRASADSVHVVPAYDDIDEIMHDDTGEAAQAIVQKFPVAAKPVVATH